MFNNKLKKNINDILIKEALDLTKPFIYLSSAKIAYINNAFSNLLGYKSNELLGKPLSQITPVLDIATLEEKKSLVFKSCNNTNQEFYVKIQKLASQTKTLNYIIEISSPQIPNPNNEQIQQINQQIENLKSQISNLIKEQNPNPLDNQTQRLLNAINSLETGFIVIDNSGKIIFINESAHTLKLFPENEQNTNLSDIILPEKIKNKLLELTNSSLNNYQSSILKDTRIENKYFDIVISSITDSQQNSLITGAVIFLQDKTEERLFKRSKENFYIIASHELRTPLTGIRGYIDIIKELYIDNLKGEELKRIIQDIDASSSRLINIINDFLDTSKLEKDTIILRPEACDLVTIIKSCLKETTPLALEKKLSLELSTVPEKATVFGDKDKIKQIIINLISNALKYTQHGGVKVCIESKENLFQVLVQDTGQGISKEDQKLLFTKYQQIPTSGHKKVISSGLGLYISKILAEKMKGTLTLENSTENQGSTFAFSIPIYHEV